MMAFYVISLSLVSKLITMIYYLKEKRKTLGRPCIHNLQSEECFLAVCR